MSEQAKTTTLTAALDAVAREHQELLNLRAEVARLREALKNIGTVGNNIAADLADVALDESPFGDDAGPFCAVDNCQGEPTICQAHYDRWPAASCPPGEKPEGR